VHFNNLFKLSRVFSETFLIEMMKIVFKFKYSLLFLLPIVLVSYNQLDAAAIEKTTRVSILPGIDSGGLNKYFRGRYLPVCEDVKSKRKKCDNIGAKNRQTGKCKKTFIASICPKTCWSCNPNTCEDNSSFFWKKEIKNCAWFSSKKNQKFCKRSFLGKLISERCPESCMKTLKMTSNKLIEAVSLYLSDRTKAICEYGKIGNFDTSKVKIMEYLFDSSQFNSSQFNEDISAWQTSEVRVLKYLFKNTEEFNSAIGTWQTSKVISMEGAFFTALKFNADIGSWDTRAVFNFNETFYQAFVFERDLGSWDTSNAKHMGAMFYRAGKFNSDISAWETSKVLNMDYMFADAAAFNIDLSAWDTSRVTAAQWLFSGATVFDQDLSSWQTSNMHSIYAMFTMTDFNSDLSDWDVSEAYKVARMFELNTKFNSDVSGWDTSKFYAMKRMFNGACSFDTSFTDSWDLSNADPGKIECYIKCGLENCK